MGIVRRYRLLSLGLAVVAVLAAFLSFFFVFLVAPVVPLALFYLGYLAIRERRARAERRGDLVLLEREAKARDRQLLREAR